MIEHPTAMDVQRIVDGDDRPPGGLTGCALWLLTVVLAGAVLFVGIWAASR